MITIIAIIWGAFSTLIDKRTSAVELTETRARPDSNVLMAREVVERERADQRKDGEQRNNGGTGQQIHLDRGLGRGFIKINIKMGNFQQFRVKACFPYYIIFI